MSIISSTRRGFLYQDRFAVLKYLELLQSKNIKEFYIDYVLGESKKSLDVRLIRQDSLEEVYEIKSGESFKLDKRKGETSEIRDAFVKLNEYLSINEEAKLYIIIRKSFKNKIAEYWQKITYIQEHSFRYPQTKKHLRWLLKVLRINEFKNIEELFNFCLKFKLDDADDDILENDDDQYPKIEDSILSKINDLANLFSVDACNYELHSEFLMYKLLHKCRLHAGLNNDLHTVFKNEIVNFFSLRYFFDKQYKPQSNRADSRNNIKMEMEKKFDKLLGGQNNIQKRGVEGNINQPPQEGIGTPSE